ncbi:hypothetical protein MUP06_01390 [Patescibacteria group bacterium]|nr:hypothetical protein [Patescibacteria group bacterium]
MLLWLSTPAVAVNRTSNGDGVSASASIGVYIDFSGVGTRHERGSSQPNTSIQEKNSKVKTENQKTSHETKRAQTIPKIVIFVDANDDILRMASNMRMVSNTNDVILLVRRGGPWLRDSVPAEMNSKILKQYEELRSKVDWESGAGIRYDKK